MMGPAKGYSKLVAYLASKGAELCKLKMMGVRRLTPTDETSLLGDEPQMRLVAVSPGLAECKHALIDALQVIFNAAVGTNALIPD